MICASLFHFDKDAGLRAVLVLTIEAWGRYFLNVTLNQTSETKKRDRAGDAGPAQFRCCVSYLLPRFAVVMSKRKQGILLANFGFTKSRRRITLRSSKRRVLRQILAWGQLTPLLHLRGLLPVKGSQQPGPGWPWYRTSWQTGNGIKDSSEAADD